MGQPVTSPREKRQEVKSQSAVRRMLPQMKMEKKKANALMNWLSTCPQSQVSAWRKAVRPHCQARLEGCAPYWRQQTAHRHALCFRTRTNALEEPPCAPDHVNTMHSKPKTTHLKLNIIPDRFDGKTPWNEYIGHFEACRMANAWDDTQAKVFLVASLRGPALKTFGGKTSNSSSLSYHELVRLLQKRFGPGQLAENYLLELRYRRQGPRETIQELG